MRKLKDLFWNLRMAWEESLREDFPGAGYSKF